MYIRPKPEPWGKPGKKALRTQGFQFLSVRKKVRPSAGKDRHNFITKKVSSL